MCTVDTSAPFCDFALVLCLSVNSCLVEINRPFLLLYLQIAQSRRFHVTRDLFELNLGKVT